MTVNINNLTLSLSVPSIQYIWLLLIALIISRLTRSDSYFCLPYCTSCACVNLFIICLNIYLILSNNTLLQGATWGCCWATPCCTSPSWSTPCWASPPPATPQPAPSAPSTPGTRSTRSNSDHNIVYIRGPVKKCVENSTLGSILYNNLAHCLQFSIRKINLNI